MHRSCLLIMMMVLLISSTRFARAARGSFAASLACCIQCLCVRLCIFPFLFCSLSFSPLSICIFSNFSSRCCCLLQQQRYLSKESEACHGESQPLNSAPGLLTLYPNRQTLNPKPQSETATPRRHTLCPLKLLLSQLRHLGVPRLPAGGLSLMHIEL